MESKQLKHQQIRKIMTLTLYIFPFLLNNQSLSELLHSTEADKRLEKLKCSHFDMKVTLTTHLMAALHCFNFRIEHCVVFQNGTY